MEGALTQADRPCVGVSILAGGHRRLLERLQPLTARHLVQQTVLAGGDCTASNLRSSLEDAGPDLRPGTILFLTLVDVDFDWEPQLKANLATFPAGLRIFGLSTGRQARLDHVSTKASLLWLEWPGKETTHFVDGLLDLWQEGAYPFGYTRFADDLASVLPGSPRPRILVRGMAAPSFDNQRPFTVSPPPPAPLVALMESLADSVRTKRPVTLRYRNQQSNEVRLIFTPRLLGTSDGDWRVWGQGANQDYCLHLSRVIAVEGIRQPSNQSASAPSTRDHYQHCIEVVDVWAPTTRHDG
ncbi:MAG: hypothetical protein QOH92_3701 [Chloroflexota bacterium]|jgi:hypothetical protein|nr:hypothetical protein [Chloroflexota bacterium]